jgi:acyl-CoA synthetase (AMP-forming)/AMP-acid ligase II
MYIDFLRQVFDENRDSSALVWRDRCCSYEELSGLIEHWSARLPELQITPSDVVSLEADFSPTAVALMLALIESRCILVPLTESVRAQHAEFRETAQVEATLRVAADDTVRARRTGRRAAHELLLRLKALGHPGLILFSSGSTGRSKGAVHDFLPLLEKFKVRRRALRTVTFLLFDHIGGINTLFHTLSNGGCVITISDRSPDVVCSQIARHRAEVLPASPTFLNLLLLSEAFRDHDMRSLELVSYGTEVMPETTLRRFCEDFPGVRLQQMYGLSELGILRSKSRSSDSTWVKVGGEGFETRIVDGMLEIKARSAMLGYLNAPSPFTADGWFKTGDAVEADGDYLRILGRLSELINVGGEKVFPAEVENVLQHMDGVMDVVVSAEPNPLTGQLVKAAVQLAAPEPLDQFRRRMRAFCQDRLPRHKIPQKVEFMTEAAHGARFKKMRSGKVPCR